MGTATTTRGRLLIVSGLVLVGVLFVWYDRYQDPGALTPEAISTIHWLAHMFYLLLVACLGMVALGMYLFHKSAVGGSGGLVGVIAEATWNGRSRRIFAVVFVVYGVFFSMASGTLVYQPQVDFAAHYGAQIPSWFIAPCCGDPGYMPTIIVYLSNHIGLQVLPLNLMLQVVVSYLVGLNAALAAVAYAASRGARGRRGGRGADRAVCCLPHLRRDGLVDIHRYGRRDRPEHSPGAAADAVHRRQHPGPGGDALPAGTPAQVMPRPVRDPPASP